MARLLKTKHFDKEYDDFIEREIYLYLGKKMIGSVRAEVHMDGYVEDLYISKKYRGSGYGVDLMRSLEDYVFNIRDRVVLTVEATKGNLIGWYTRQGYTNQGMVTQDGVLKILMWKDKI